jgi:hypothetical protein
MAYTLNNSIIYNEAFTAYVFVRGNAVASAGTPPSDNPQDPTGAAYAGSVLLNEATTFAQAVDTAIANDSNISDMSGVALQPSTQVIQQAQLGLTAAIRGACYAFLCPGGSWLNFMPGGMRVVPGSSIGNQILALYTITKITMLFPVPVPH